jgi:hypothetical protein
MTSLAPPCRLPDLPGLPEPKIAKILFLINLGNWIQGGRQGGDRKVREVRQAQTQVSFFQGVQAEKFLFADAHPTRRKMILRTLRILNNCATPNHLQDSRTHIYILPVQARYQLQSHSPQHRCIPPWNIHVRCCYNIHS